MAGNDMTYDDARLQKLLDVLNPKQRERAMRGAFRQEANRVAKSAQEPPADVHEL